MAGRKCNFSIFPQCADTCDDFAAEFKQSELTFTLTVITIFFFRFQNKLDYFDKQWRHNLINKTSQKKLQVPKTFLWSFWLTTKSSFSPGNPWLGLQVPQQEREQGSVRHLRPSPQVRRPGWLRQVLHLPQWRLTEGPGMRTGTRLQHGHLVLRFARKRPRMVKYLLPVPGTYTADILGI